ncbi:MAG TPA: thiosulfate oxidation carrier protein SoxY [Dokdonella sp.]|jgi:sulfur-oxidizing protein SoxY|nr:thiosulfate oxidation carrier protein SoxY [Dokdonella sp.]
MNSTRRRFLQAGAGGGVALLLVASGLSPRLALAAQGSPLAPGDERKAFEAMTLDDVVKQLGGEKAEASAEIDLKAPEIAENGAVVPIEITSKLPGTKMIAIVSEKNPHALSAAFQIPEGTEPFVSTRVKVAETSKVFALVQTDKGFFYTDHLVKVTLGGCGG